MSRTTSCSRCKDNYVIDDLSPSVVGCIEFNSVNYPNKVYVPFLQSTAPLFYTLPTPVYLSRTGNRYTYTLTSFCPPEQASVFLNIEIEFIYDPSIPNIYSHYDVFLYEDGEVIQTRAVPYTVTSFSSKILVFDAVRHYTNFGYHTYSIESMHSARINRWQIGLDAYEPSELCWYPANSQYCLLCNMKKNYYSLYGDCEILGEGSGSSRMIGVEFNQYSYSCDSNIKYCYLDKVVECYDGYYPDATNDTCIGCA